LKLISYEIGNTQHQVMKTVDQLEVALAQAVG
jgi:hypothetical protein